MASVSRVLTFGRVAVETPTGARPVSGRLADLLLLLLECPDGWVTRDALIDRLWETGDVVPPSVRSALRTYIAKARELLGDDAVITRKSPCAYRLDRTLVQSDFDEVREALRIARLRIGTDPVGALDLLDHARSMATGEPFGGIDNPWLLATRMSIEELIDDLDDEFCCALVTCGLAVERLDEIARLAEHRPLRERRTEMLMLALRQAGRRREALRVAAVHHHRMVDQTGLSAAAEIRLLEQQILFEDDREPTAPMPTPADLVAAIAVEPFESSVELLALVLNTTEVEVTELHARAQSLAMLTGELGSATVTAPMLSDADVCRWRESWIRVAGLSSWRVLDHRAALGLLANDEADAVNRAARAACDHGRADAAAVLLDRFLTADRMTDRFGRGTERRTTVDLLYTQATVLDQLGQSAEALDKRALAVDLALAEDWVEAAATMAVADTGTGRSYVEDEQVTDLIRRTLNRLDAGQRSAHTVRLLSELLCRTVLDAGLTAELEPIYERLVALRPTLQNPVDQAHAYRARLYVAVSQGEVLEDSALTEMLTQCSALALEDHVSDLLTVAARSALERGNPQAWRDAVDALADLATRSRRPVDLWCRIALRAADLQIRGQHHAAAVQADDALILGTKWSIADATITADSFELAATWQASQFRSEDPARVVGQSAVAFTRQLLARSYNGTLAGDDLLLDVLVQSSVDASLPGNRSLESLPLLLIAVQAAWNAGYEKRWSEMLTALDSWPVQGSALGMIPIATFGPVGRFRALAAIKLGDLALARHHLGVALAWCESMRAHGWTALTLDDLAHLEDLSGSGRASALRAEAQYLRQARRLRSRRTTTWLQGTRA